MKMLTWMLKMLRCPYGVSQFNNVLLVWFFMLVLECDCLYWFFISSTDTSYRWQIERDQKEFSFETLFVKVINRVSSSESLDQVYV